MLDPIGMRFIGTFNVTLPLWELHRQASALPCCQYLYMGTNCLESISTLNGLPAAANCEPHMPTTFKLKDTRIQNIHVSGVPFAAVIMEVCLPGAVQTRMSMPPALRMLAG